MRKRKRTILSHRGTIIRRSAPPSFRRRLTGVGLCFAFFSHSAVHHPALRATFFQKKAFRGRRFAQIFICAYGALPAPSSRLPAVLRLPEKPSTIKAGPLISHLSSLVSRFPSLISHRCGIIFYKCIHFFGCISKIFGKGFPCRIFRSGFRLCGRVWMRRRRGLRFIKA